MAHPFHIDTIQAKFSLCMPNYYSRHIPLMKSTPAPFYLVFFTPPLPETNYEKYMFQILPTNRNPTYLSGSLPSKVQAK